MARVVLRREPRPELGGRAYRVMVETDDELWFSGLRHSGEVVVAENGRQAWFRWRRDDSSPRGRIPTARRAFDEDDVQPALFTADDPGDLLIEQEPRN
jgi:hypothetical protein